MSMVHKISIKHVESTATDRLEPQNRISSMTGMFAACTWVMVHVIHDGMCAHGCCHKLK